MKQVGRVYLLCGKVASGKTTYARKQVQQGRAILLSLDELHLSIFGSEPTREQIDDSYDSCCAYQQNLALKLLNLGIDVYIDWGFWSRAARVQAKRFFEAQGMVVSMIYFSLTDEERLARNRLRNAGSDPHSFKIEEKDVSLFDSYFETPSPEEYDLVIGAEH
ncbi:AAA family ATPase [Agarivorans sp. Z349TD_8]|uniref:AAA family ATPase n=1 Tax=Agarivorans sp. Z349TD_8 TaxID=3421434 RepID=UPI003D7C6170